MSTKHRRVSRIALTAAVVVSAAAACAPAGAATATPAPHGPWDAYNLAPATRDVAPPKVFRTGGAVTAPEAAPAGRTTTLPAGASVTYDFGKEVGGYVSLSVAAGGDPGTVGLTYSESAQYVDPDHSDGSNGGTNDEPAVTYAAAPGGTVSTHTSVPTGGASDAAKANPASQLRGGFRYLTVSNRGTTPLALDGVSVAITFDPSAKDLRAYPNYFYSDDELLNRIWYAGAYTVQTNTIANDTGRVWGPPSVGWNNSATIGESGDTVIVDGAKRDRTVWPGDLGISVPSHFSSLGDLTAVRSSLQTLFNHQRADGALPYAGPAVNFIGDSDAYHMWSLIGTATYLQYSGDTPWLDTVWPKYERGLRYILDKIDPDDDLLNVTAASDWARTESGGKNIEANAIMYHLLGTCQAVAKLHGDDALAAECATKQAALKVAVNTGGYWNAKAGLYRNLPGRSLLPQDGNALAVWYGLTDSDDQRQAISAALKDRWTPVGALTPEKSAQSVHPFPGSMEVMAHLVAGDDSRAIELMKLEWGHMLDSPNGTASTFWEGYRTDGSSDYGGSYQSLAHGWSTGPTSALTFYVLGIDPDPSGAPTYRLLPHPGSLKHAEGQLTTPFGVIRQSWDRDPDAGGFALRYTAPEGVVSDVGVPTAGRRVAVRVDGDLVWDGDRAVGGSDAALEDGYVTVSARAGTHEVRSAPAAPADAGGGTGAGGTTLAPAPAPGPAPSPSPSPGLPAGTPAGASAIWRPALGAAPVRVGRAGAAVKLRIGRSAGAGDRGRGTVTIATGGRTIGRRAVSVRPNRWATVLVRLDASARRRLAADGRLRAVVRLQSTGRDGVVRRTQRTVQLRATR